MRWMKNMRMAKRIFLCFGILSLFFVFYVFYILCQFTRPTNNDDNANINKQREMMRIIVDCGELAPIPKTAKIKTIETEGNMFTRSFRLIFEADKDTIQNWLHASKGVRLAKHVKNEKLDRYILNIKHDYGYGDIKINYQNNRVIVYISKS